jgi:hypothetical protein
LARYADDTYRPFLVSVSVRRCDEDFGELIFAEFLPDEGYKRMRFFDFLDDLWLAFALKGGPVLKFVYFFRRYKSL